MRASPEASCEKMLMTILPQCLFLEKKKTKYVNILNAQSAHLEAENV